MIVYQNNFLIFDVNSQTSDVKTHILKVPGDSKDIVENYRTKFR
jgi:hypothetical protein